MQLTVRAACLDDLDAMVGLLQLLFAQEADFEPNPERQRVALRAILAAPELGTLLVAEVQTEVIGMVNLLYTISTAEGGVAAWMEDMVVHPRFRGVKIGSRLLDAAVEICRSKAIQRLTLLTDQSNESAQRFYRRHGFATSEMVPFRRRC